LKLLIVWHRLCRYEGEDCARQELKRSSSIHGVQGMFTPTVLAAPGENNPRKSVRIRAPVSSPTRRIVGDQQRIEKLIAAQ
jgi:hypothetical protein